MAKRLFVGGISYSTTNAQLEELRTARATRPPQVAFLQATAQRQMATPKAKIYLYSAKW